MPFRSWFQRQQTCPTCRLNILRAPITSTTQANNNQQAPAAQANNQQRQNEPQQPPIIQQNPFLNLLNQTATAPNPSSSTTPLIPPVNPTSQTTAPPIPPFPFFPPFMAPFSIPPPPMPANLDQLTTEELQAMEGNERKHIEERLKLLKNVNTMINASIAMMTQYQTIVSNLPPVAIPSASASTSGNKTESNITSTTDVKVDHPNIKIEDLGSEEHLDSVKKPSTSSAGLFEEPSSSSSNKSSTVDSSTTLIANEISSNVESEETNEIRKRRLQKFLQNN